MTWTKTTVRAKCRDGGCNNGATVKGLCEKHYQREHKRQRKSQPPLPAVLNCKECGGAFEPVHRRACFCSADCRWRHGRRAYDARRGGMRGRQLWHRYRLTLARFDELLAAQGGRCAICRTDAPGVQGWAVDHDHACCATKAGSCGKCVRGVLCFHCNALLGCANDDTGRLRRAIAYLGATP